MPITHYVWFGENLLAEYDEHGNSIVQYNVEPDPHGSVISQTRNGETHHFLYDGQGNVTEVVDEAGAVTDTRRYTAFGEVVEETGTTEFPYQFAGRSGYYYDKERDSYYVRRRHYDMRRGRWLSVDPLGSDDVLELPDYATNNPLAYINLYNYVLNDPIRYVDPSGLRECEIRVYGGHFAPALAIDEISRILDRLKAVDPGRLPKGIGGVGCARDQMQKKIGDLFPGREIPGMPAVPGDLPRKPGPASEAMESAYLAARDYVANVCDRVGCDSVIINFVCTHDMIETLRSTRQKVLCEGGRRSGGDFPNVFRCT